ncbi:MAG: SLC13 family permease [Planctomycetota bacterium]
MIFATTYICIIAFHKFKLPIIAAAICILLAWPGLLSFPKAIAAVNWNVIMLFFGMLFMTEVLVISRAPAVLAEHLLARKVSAGGALLIVCLVSGFISAFVENVAVVLLVAPVALAVTRRMKVSPVTVLIGVSVCSNLQGAATLIGDPPSMLLANALNMNFVEFFWYHGKPGIFFAVELGALVSAGVLWFFFRKYTGRTPEPVQEKIQGWLPVILMIVLAAGLALASVFIPEWEWSAGGITLILGVVAAAWWRHRRDGVTFRTEVKRLDWGTGFFLIGIFILVGSVIENGIMKLFIDHLAALTGENLFIAYSLLVWGSVALSAFVDNIPYVAAMLPVCAGIALAMQVPVELLAFGMVVGASIGGNITPIGASANIVAVGIAKKEGYHVSFREFAAIGLPFTIAATVAAYIFLWFVWR